MLQIMYLFKSLSWTLTLPSCVIVAEESLVVSEPFCFVVVSSSRHNLFWSDCMTSKGYLTTLFLETKYESFTTSNVPPIEKNY